MFLLPVMLPTRATAAAETFIEIDVRAEFTVPAAWRCLCDRLGGLRGRAIVVEQVPREPAETVLTGQLNAKAI